MGLYGKCKLLRIEATNGILVFLDDPSIKMSIRMRLMSASSNYKALVPMENMLFFFHIFQAEITPVNLSLIIAAYMPLTQSTVLLQTLTKA